MKRKTRNSSNAIRNETKKKRERESIEIAKIGKIITSLNK